MSPEIIFNLHLILGDVAGLPCFRAYLLPRLKSMDQVEAHRAIATRHSLPFFGLVLGNPWNIADKLTLNPKVDVFFYLAVGGFPHYGRFTDLKRPNRR
jgi:hypothetical protein